MYEYEHTQSGTLIRYLIGGLVLALGIGAIAMLAIGMGAEAAIALIVPTAILAIVLALFHSLTVRVSRNEIALAFGIGLIRKSFVVPDIQVATIVRNRWYHGWGIKKIRGGWLYNVSGWDAVEIQLENGRRYRIGTDQPQELLAAIESAAAIAS